MKCLHKDTYAVDTHDRIDCCDCDETIIEGQQAVALREEVVRLRTRLHQQTTLLREARDYIDADDPDFSPKEERDLAKRIDAALGEE